MVQVDNRELIQNYSFGVGILVERKCCYRVLFTFRGRIPDLLDPRPVDRCVADPNGSPGGKLKNLRAERSVRNNSNARNQWRHQEILARYP